MFKKLSLIVIFAFAVSLTAQNQSNIIERIKNDNWQTIEKVDISGEVYKITDILSGKSIYKNLGEYEKLNKTVIAAKVDTTVIYPFELDSLEYVDMYSYWTTVDAATSGGVGIVYVGDANNNGRKEIYGTRQDSYLDIYEHSIYELNLDQSGFDLKYNIPVEGVMHIYSFKDIYDIDNDGNKEVYLTARRAYARPDPDTVSQLDTFGIGRAYKLSDSTNLPTDLLFEYNEFHQVNDPVWGNYDNNNKADLVHVSFDTLVVSHYVKFSEYNPSQNKVNERDTLYINEEVFYVGGFSTGKIDGDTYPDIGVGGLYGDVLIYEYQENTKKYVQTWHGDAGTFNVYMHWSSNDINNNGKNELWVGGDATYNGVAKTRITCFEAIGNNDYEPVHVIDIVGIFSTSAYNGFAADVDNDGTEELLICIDGAVFILENEGENNEWNFQVKYFTKGYFHGAIVNDLDNDGNMELLTMQHESINNYKNYKHLTQIFKPDAILDVDRKINTLPNEYSLEQNYPNPFNPSTKIEYIIPNTEFVSLKVYDVLGREVTTLVNKEQPPGNYEIQFNGDDLNSGIYFIRIKTGKYTNTIKAVLIK